MTSIDFSCPNCGQKLSADKTLSESITLCPVCEQAIRVPQFNVRPGMRLGDFILKNKLGAGGMGEVWLAEQQSMQREVALKILSPSLSDDDDFCTRFQHEAKNSGKMMHPNIVTAFYAGLEDHIHYLAMSYVEGVPLDEELLEKEKTGRMSEENILSIVLDVAEALKYGWDKFKLIHRDIKPSNIMLCTDGSAKLLDLGISKSIIEGDSALTRTGIFIGTPFYISPEQAKNISDLDCRADIYSLGGVVYHMLTGNVPYNATTPMGVVAMHLSEPLPDIRQSNPNASNEIISLTQKMMEKKRDNRFENWDEVIAEIKKIRSKTVNNTLLSKLLPAVLKEKRVIPYLVVITVFIIIIIALLLNFPTRKTEYHDSDGLSITKKQTTEKKTDTTVAPEKKQTKENSKRPFPKNAPSVTPPQSPVSEKAPEHDNFMDFFAGRAHLTKKEQSAARKIIRVARRQSQKVFDGFRRGDITRSELRDRLYNIKRKEMQKLRNILSSEQMAIYKEWDNEKRNNTRRFRRDRYRHSE